MQIEKAKEKVILVGVQTWESDQHFAYSLEELGQLVETAQGQVLTSLTQKREAYSGATMIGKGKVEELAHLVEELEADLVIFNQSLSGSMVRNLSQVIHVPIIDRVQLILDIFAMRAKSKEGKLQVQLAQLNYLLPRLSGQGQHLSRQGGGIGARGPGETKLETDRRHIRKQIQDIEAQLEETKKHRNRASAKRRESDSFQIGLIGYTNAGKSTLLNRLTQADTYEMDQLFATLDPLTRQLDLFSNYQVTLTDTVGFIQDLPTALVSAFESTLEQSAQVDLLLQVVDASAENFLVHEQTVKKLVKDLDMEAIPMVTIYNKMDLAPKDFQAQSYPNKQISALNPQDILDLKDWLKQLVLENMEAYSELVEVTNPTRLSYLQTHTMVDTMDFMEANNAYLVKGYTNRNR